MHCWAVVPLLFDRITWMLTCTDDRFLICSLLCHYWHRVMQNLEVFQISCWFLSFDSASACVNIAIPCLWSRFVYAFVTSALPCSGILSHVSSGALLMSIAACLPCGSRNLDLFYILTLELTSLPFILQHLISIKILLNGKHCCCGC